MPSTRLKAKREQRRTRFHGATQAIQKSKLTTPISTASQKSTVRGRGRKKKSSDVAQEVFPTVPRQHKKSSFVWQFFERLPIHGPNPKMQRPSRCILCNKRFNNPRASTTSMLMHLRRIHSEVLERRNTVHQNDEADARSSSSPLPGQNADQNNHYELVISSDARTEEPDHEFSAEVEIRGQFCSSGNMETTLSLPAPVEPVNSISIEAILKNIVIHLASEGKPLYTCDKAAYKKLLFELNSEFSREIILKTGGILLPLVTETMDRLVMETKQMMREELVHKYVCLSLELWIKSKNEVYAIVKANFVADDWKLRNLLLGVRRLQNGTVSLSSGEIADNLTTIVKNCLTEFEIPDKNVMLIVGNFLPFKISQIGQFRIWPCFNEVLKRSYDMLFDFARDKKGQDVYAVFQNIKVKTRDVELNKIELHPARLMKTVEEYMVNTDTFSSIAIEGFYELLMLQRPLTELLDGLLDENQIHGSALLPVVRTTKAMFESMATRESVFEDGSWTPAEKLLISGEITKYMEESYCINFEGRTDLTLTLSAFLDPRYRDLEFLTYAERQYAYDTLLKLLTELEDDKPRNGSVLTTKASTSRHEPQPSTSRASSSKLDALFNNHLGKKNNFTPSRNAQLQLKGYCQEPSLEMNSDPFTWWKENSKQYPTLSELAKRHMAIIGMASPASMCFTVAGNAFRENLTFIEAEHVEKLQLLQAFYESRLDEEDVILTQDDFQLEADPIINSGNSSSMTHNNQYRLNANQKSGGILIKVEDPEYAGVVVRNVVSLRPNLDA